MQDTRYKILNTDPRASWMHLDLDAFFASVEVYLNPTLKGKPVLVGGVNPQGKNVPRGVVATASYEAREFGCRSGMPLFQALKLCPRAIVVGGHYEEYVKASQQVMKIAARYAPGVEQIGIDEAFLDFSGTEWIYPDLKVVAEKIRSEIKKEVGITASIGIAATKVVAKVASDFNKPDGVTCVEKGAEKEFLAPLPLQSLPGVNHKTELKLTTILDSIIVNKNRFTIGDFATLPKDFVEEKLGQGGLNLWNAANGCDNICFEPREVVKSVSRSETFAQNSKDPKFILAMLQYLAEKVGTELREKGYSGRCVHVAIRYADFRTVGRQRVLPYPTNLTREIYEMGETLLKELWDGVTPLRLIGIGISQFGETVQSSLFDGGREKRLELEKRIDRLKSRFGLDAIIPASFIKFKI